MQTHSTRDSNKGVADIHKRSLREYVSRNQDETPGLLSWGNDDGGTHTVQDFAADIPRWLTESAQLNSTRLRFWHHSKVVQSANAQPKAQPKAQAPFECDNQIRATQLCQCRL